MFSTFGASGSQFAANNSTNSPFGQAPKTATPPFGQPTTSVFGAQQQPSSLFSAPQNLFSQAFNKETAFGSKIFGTSAPFTSNAFASTSQQPVFGQQPTKNQMDTCANQNNAFKLFEGSNLATNDKLGTVVKFKPVKDSETSFKGLGQNVASITYQSITCMKEYEGKSFEELRLEDYQVNRKGPQSGFSANVTASNATSFFNSPTPLTSATPSIFGSGAAKSAFGPTTSSVFGQTGQTNSLFSPGIGKNTSGVFGNTKPSFGVNQNTPVFGTNTQTGSVFQTNQTNLQNPFGTSFGQPNITQPTFGLNQATTSQNVGLFNQNTNVFDPNKAAAFKLSLPTTAPNLVPNKASTTPSLSFNFGQSNQGKLFTNNFPNNNATTGIFGQPLQSSTPATGLSSVFDSRIKPNSFLNNTNTLAFNPNNSVNVTSNLDQNANYQQQILAMASNPYGISNILTNISLTDSYLEQCKRVTNPRELRTVLQSVKQPQIFPKSNKIVPVQIFDKNDAMFCGLEYNDESLISNIRINFNPKRLIIRKNNKESIRESANLTNMTPIGFNPSSDLEELNYDSRVLTAIVEESPKKNIVEEKQDFDKKGEEKVAVEEIAEDIEAQDVEDDASDVSVSHPDPVDPVPHPTGIILTRPEYYTIPSLDELTQNLNKDGSCFVKGFTIGRYGYGNVHFPDTFDVSNINIDEIVHFRYKEIIIYSDDSKKPPLGQGLNRKAQITLDKVWPKDKTSNKRIEDVEYLSKIDYAAKLKKACDRQGTVFVDYRPDTGSWVFKVNHF